jgi:2,4-dichlorophenol 6-monooxygenase
MSQNREHEELRTPVLIVGGGGAGLTASMLLSQLGVESLVVNARPSTSDLPKAHLLNQRTMEILSDTGVSDEVYRRGTPRENMRASAWYAGFGGDDSSAGKKVGQVETWGAGGADTNWEAASPCSSTNLPQIRLEPILRERAEKLAPGRVLFHHELCQLREEGDEVLARIRSIDDDREYTVRSKFVLACDGGRTVGPALGIEMEGPRDVAQQVSIHMTADLSRWARDPEVLIRWIWAPDSGSLGVLVPMGPERWGPESEEWVFHLGYPTNDPRALDDSAIESDMRRALGIGDHPVEIHKTTRWSLEGVVASRFQAGRVFLLGDAAHRHPPTGGLGLNSAIQDAHNICWKLEAVLSGRAPQALLASYEPERKPVVARNVEHSLDNSKNQFQIWRDLGVEPGGDADASWKMLGRLVSLEPEDRDHRRAATRAIASQSQEFRAHNIEYGYTYTESGSAVVSVDHEQIDSVDSVRIYNPSTSPGHPLPHAWLETDEGRHISTLELVRPGHFLLIAGEEGDAWCAAAISVAEAMNVPLDTVRIGHLRGDYRDARCEWLQRREIGTNGAILVRPDRFIAWRCSEGCAEPEHELRQALQAGLGIENKGETA